MTITPKELVELQSMDTAPRDRSFILARVRADDERYPARWFAVFHEGETPSGFDLGWGLFPGYGGVPDSHFDGWLPLPGTALSRLQTVDREAIIRDCAELAFRCAAPIVITQTAYDDGARDAGNAILALLHPIDDISETGGGV